MFRPGRAEPVMVAELLWRNLTPAITGDVCFGLKVPKAGVTCRSPHPARENRAGMTSWGERYPPWKFRVVTWVVTDELIEALVGYKVVFLRQCGAWPGAPKPWVKTGGPPFLAAG